MTSDVLISQLQKAGWSEFGPGDFLGVEFDAVGKARVARNNWFVLLKSIPVLDVAGIDTWSDHYARFHKRADAGMFRSGKYFILILLVDTIGAGALERFSEGPPSFLEDSELIARGGGYVIVVVKDRKRVLMPDEITLWDMVQATQFVGRTHGAVADYLNAISPGESDSEDRRSQGFGTILTKRYGHRDWHK